MPEQEPTFADRILVRSLERVGPYGQNAAGTMLTVMALGGAYETGKLTHDVLFSSSGTYSSVNDRIYHFQSNLRSLHITERLTGNELSQPARNTIADEISSTKKYIGVQKSNCLLTTILT